MKMNSVNLVEYYQCLNCGQESNHYGQRPSVPDRLQVVILDTKALILLRLEVSGMSSCILCWYLIVGRITKSKYRGGVELEYARKDKLSWDMIQNIIWY